MELLVLSAIIVAVASSPHTEIKTWPWQLGKEYLYDVNSYTWTKFEQSNNYGNAFKAQFYIRVIGPGHLEAKLESPLHANIQGQISKDALPSDLKYQPVQDIDHPFEIFVDGGRVLVLKIPNTLSVAYENLLKGLISAFQVDLSNFGLVHNFPNSYDKETFQGLLKKMEADVTGDCETLYSVSPVSADCRRELPEFAEESIEIAKSKNYGSCQKRVGYDFGVPEGAVWKGMTYENDEKQFITHTSRSRMLIGKQGTIYKSETMSSVLVNPLLFEKQKAEVHSDVSVYLTSISQESSAKWHKSVEFRKIDSLLFTITGTMFTKVDEQNIVSAQKLLQKMSLLLQDPNNLPKADFLSKFNILKHLIISMNPEQLTQMTTNIEIVNSSENLVQNGMWIIYRDAVAQAGTVEAFKEIKSWILNKKIQGNEAGEIITSLSSNMRYYSSELLDEFFELAISPEVLSQKFLNTSALLAATKFVRSAKNDLFVVEKVIPHLSDELKQAIETGDSNKAQVYVRVLGNLAHQNVLKIFTPYLEGQIAISKYLRIQMVISLKTLAITRNDYVRAVLFSILRNTAEPYEVRVAAALNIFLTYPTVEMMQIMAYMANKDPSTQVRSVLANSITFAAKLKNPRFAELAKNAQAVLNNIARENVGARYSTDSMIDDYKSEDEVSHFGEISFIASKNSFSSVYRREAFSFKNTWWNEENWFEISISDVQDLVNLIALMIVQPRKVNDDFKFSAKNIVKILNIKREPRSPIEGSFFFDNWNQQTLITFNEDDLNKFMMNNANQMGLSGVETRYTKILNNKQVFVIFPLAMGMPFMLEYSEPTAFIIQGLNKVKVGRSNGIDVSLYSELEFTYARNLDGSIGFLDTIGDVYASVGVINKLQFYIPVKLNIETKTKTKEYHLNFIFPTEDKNLAHMSIWPYTTLQKMNSLLTVLEDPATKIIERPSKVLSTELKLGQLTGTVFHLQGYSYSSDYKDSRKLFDTDFLTNLLYQKDVALTKFNLKYLAKESQSKAVKCSLVYDTLYNQEVSGEMGPATVMNNTVNSVDRRYKLVKRVASGIKTAKVELVDMNAVFDGKQKIEYAFIAVIASSFKDNKVQAGLFFLGNEQLNAVFKMIKPKIVPMNFEEALKNEIKITYDADVTYGNSKNVHFQGFGERSKKYTEMLLKDPMANKCMLETSINNYYQNECYKMIVKAHTPDYFKAIVTYNNFTTADLNMIHNIYGFYKHFYGWDEDVSPLMTVDDGKVEIEAQAFYYEKYMNYQFTSKYGIIRLHNIKFSWHPNAMAIYTPTTNWERSGTKFTGYQNLPFCTVDDNKVLTFSGRSYNYSLTSSWHVVMVDESSYFGRWTDLLIMARRPSQKQAEVYISYKTPSKWTLEVEIKPTTVEVKSNTKKVSEGAVTMYWDAIANAPILEYYNLSDDVKVFHIRNGDLRLMYDGQRLVIFTKNHLSTTRGICGQSSTEIGDDYMTPWGLVDLPEHYGASFSLEDDFSDPKTVELKKEAKVKAYQPITKFTTIPRFDTEWSKDDNRSIKRH